MYQPDFQPKPHIDAAPLERYISDMSYRSVNYVDMRIAAEKYVLGMGAVKTEEDASRLVATHFHSYEYEEGARAQEIHDILTVLPLQLVSEYADEQMNFVQATEWYGTVLQYIEDWKRPEHTQAECLESPAFAFRTASCAHSEHCPVITTAKCLDGIIFHDEEDMERWFRHDDARRRLGTYVVTAMKQRLAADFGYIHPTVAERRIENYGRIFRKFTQLNYE